MRKGLRISLEIRDRVKELRIGWLKKNYNLDLGTGLATGDAAVGHIGFKDRMNYSAVGKVINLAARLCGEAKGGQILTTEKTLEKSRKPGRHGVAKELHLKGFDHAVNAFNILSFKSGLDQFESHSRVVSSGRSGLAGIARRSRNQIRRIH